VYLCNIVLQRIRFTYIYRRHLQSRDQAPRAERAQSKATFRAAEATEQSHRDLTDAGSVILGNNMNVLSCLVSCHIRSNGRMLSNRIAAPSTSRAHK
jgi:hypothetical protein